MNEKYTYSGQWFASYNNKYYTTDYNVVSSSGRFSMDLYRLDEIGARGFTRNADGSDPGVTDSYYYASRIVKNIGNDLYFCIRLGDKAGAISILGYDSLWVATTKGNAYGFESSRGLRPVFLMDPGVKLVGAGQNIGSSSNPYRLK